MAGKTLDRYIGVLHARGMFPGEEPGNNMQDYHYNIWTAYFNILYIYFLFFERKKSLMVECHPLEPLNFRLLL